MTARPQTAVEWLCERGPQLAQFRAQDRREGVNLMVYLGDKADARVMADCERNLRDARGFGKHYKRGHFERAFRGCTAAEVLEAL